MTPNKKELGLAYKRDAKAVADALEALGEEDAMCLKVRAAPSLRWALGSTRQAVVLGQAGGRLQALSKAPGARNVSRLIANQSANMNRCRSPPQSDLDAGKPGKVVVDGKALEVRTWLTSAVCISRPCAVRLSPALLLRALSSALRLTPLLQTNQVTAPMVEIKRQQKRLAGRNFIPSVIEPSFGIGRILYCVFEHSYYTREVGAFCRTHPLRALRGRDSRTQTLAVHGKEQRRSGRHIPPPSHPQGDEARAVLKFTPLVAPVKATVGCPALGCLSWVGLSHGLSRQCACIQAQPRPPPPPQVFPLVQKEQLNVLAAKVSARWEGVFGNLLGIWPWLSCFPDLPAPCSHAEGGLSSHRALCFPSCQTPSLTAAGLSNLIDTTGNTIGKR